MNKPSYRTSKQSLWFSTIMAWSVVLILAIGAAASGKATEFGTIAVPSMVALIAALLGIHRGFGSMDFRAARETLPETPSPSPYNARDKPAVDREPA